MTPRKRLTEAAIRTRNPYWEREPDRAELEGMNDEDWVRAVRKWFRDLHRPVLEIQWDLILAGHAKGDGKALACYREAVRRVRRDERRRLTPAKVRQYREL